MEIARSEEPVEQEERRFSDPDELRATFLEHLGELRTRILRSMVALALAWVAGFYLFPIVNKLLTQPLLKVAPQGTIFVFNNFSEAFLMQLKVGLFIGLIIAAPYVVIELWMFVAPALTKNERRGIHLVAPLSILLFAVGVGFGYYVLPAAFAWFVSFIPEGTALYQNPHNFILFTVKMLLAFGLAFQLPILILFLAKIGLATPDFLWKNWRQATVIISVVAMVLTPSNDAVTMLTMAVPMVFLYFFSIGLVGWAGRADRKQMAKKTK